MHIFGSKIEKLVRIKRTFGTMTKRKVSPASLENLKLGTAARYKGKVRCTITILPRTKTWLKKHHPKENLSEQIDELVRLIEAGELVRVSVDKPS